MQKNYKLFFLLIFGLEQLYQTSIPFSPITPSLLPPNNNIALQKAQDINNLIATIQALDNQIQNQTNTVTNNTNHLEQRETKLIKIISFADAFGHWDTPNQVDRPSETVDQYAMCLHELYCQLETNANVYSEIKKVHKFTTSLRTELQIAVCLFASVNTEAYVRKRKKVVEENKTPEVQNIVVNDPQAESSKTPKAKKKRNPLQGTRFHKPTIGKDVQNYSIVQNLQQIKANISIAQLAAKNPKYLRELQKKKIKSAPKPIVTAQYADDRKFRTTVKQIYVTRIPGVETIFKGKTKEKSSDKSESEYESSSEFDKSTKYKDKQLEKKNLYS
ncbi:32347_t:CDS:2 [Racocetra persica]|uniref:32347_t:CDS:1 n=1 Tax=Racocetra persica TaxID=160502 RepID=A0ACA9L6J9_9GLOM|nr:32347_t:CDS:2 [Racocetra persica]